MFFSEYEDPMPQDWDADAGLSAVDAALQAGAG